MVLAATLKVAVIPGRPIRHVSRVGSLRKMVPHTCSRVQVECKKKGRKNSLALEPKAGKGRSGAKARSGAKSALPNSEAVPGEATFARISEDDEAFGPPAILLIGYSSEETRRVREIMHDLDAEFVQVRSLQLRMLDMTLLEAVTVPLGSYFDEEECDLGLKIPRMFIMSGLNGTEKIQLMFEVYELGLKPPIFAALVPRNADSKLSGLLADIRDDHLRLNPKAAHVDSREKELLQLKNK